jgi:4'-phosphopantetheinyl transferase
MQHDPEPAVTVLYAVVPPQAEDLIARIAPKLDPMDSARAARFAFDRDRHLFLATRALLAYALRGIAALDRWRLVTGPHGKPALDVPHGVAGVEFNLTHTPGLVACAVSPLHPVGIDAEAIGRRGDLRAIAGRCLAPEEQAALAGLGPEAWRLGFLRHWTVKEAVSKALGAGLMIPMDAIVVSGDPPALRFGSGLAEDAARFLVALRCPTPAHVLAVALHHVGVTPPLLWQEVDLAEL